MRRVDAAHNIAAERRSILAFFPSDERSVDADADVLHLHRRGNGGRPRIPGAEPGGGGYIAQRIFAAQRKRRAWAHAFFNVAHYALRPWPWILVALASIVLYPHGVIGADGKVDPGTRLRAGDDRPFARGVARLMLAGFLAAYMSTIGTHLNLGGSYLTNDLYRRFIAPRQERSGTTSSRLALRDRRRHDARVIARVTMTSVGDAWKYLFNLTAGVGLVMILRWYWWRVNAWSEISALVASAVVSNTMLVARRLHRDPNVTAKTLLVTVPITTLVGSRSRSSRSRRRARRSVRFFERVRPSRSAGSPIARDRERRAADRRWASARIDWVAGCGLVYGSLFGIGKLVLGDLTQGCIYIAVAVVCGGTIAYNVTRTSKPDLETDIPPALDSASLR